jgi:hypothetical protein
VGQELQERRARIVRGDQGTPLLDEPVEGADDDGLEQGLLGGEVTVDRTDAHPGSAGNLVDGDRKALGGEGRLGGLEDLHPVAPGVGAKRPGGAVAACTAGLTSPR